MAAPAIPAAHHNECSWVNNKVAMPTLATAPNPRGDLRARAVIITASLDTAIRAWAKG
jgi:hypothetical protein